jgi:hypothetical protein
MNKYLIFIAILALGACKSPEARYPVTQKSGSHFSESIAKNQELLEKEITLNPKGRDRMKDLLESEFPE